MKTVPPLEVLADELSPVEAVRRMGHLPDVVPYGPSVQFAARQVLEEGDEALDSIPFYSLCRGFYLGMMGLAADVERRLFGTLTPLGSLEDRLALMRRFFDKPLGLTLEEKVCLATGDLYSGRPSAVSEEVLLSLLQEETLLPRARLRQELVQAGGLPALYASKKTREKSDPPLTSRVVALCLLRLKGVRGKRRRDILRDLLLSAGRLEAYVLCGLLLDKLHMGWNSRINHVLGLLAERWGVPQESVEIACGLRDVPEVCRLVEQEGPDALRSIVLQPLSAFRPALAGATVAENLKFPVWVECKYDGIRLVLHKNTDPAGHMQVGAYTRRRHDWSELLTGLRALFQALPARSVILDGELHGYLLAASGVPRPATVYEVHQILRGEVPVAGMVQMRYVAFDLLYLDGQDLTRLPFIARRQRLEALLSFATQMQLPLPIQLSQGGRAANQEQLQRFYEQYRRQGHEGLMVKLEDSSYPLAQRSPHWMKKKPEETLDLVLSAAYWGDTAAPGQRMFDSYSVSCRTAQGLKEVGTVAGVDAVTTQQIANEIVRYNLLTGQPAEHKGSARVAYGVRLAPHIVVCIRYEAVLKDLETGELSLRGPRIISLRSGEMPVQEAASERELETLALRHRLH